MPVARLGPTNHEIFQSIYFHDPSGHRIELAANTVQPGQLERLSTGFSSSRT